MCANFIFLDPLIIRAHSAEDADDDEVRPSRREEDSKKKRKTRKYRELYVYVLCLLFLRYITGLMMALKRTQKRAALSDAS